MSRLQDYLDVDLADLLKKQDYQKIRDIDRYLNKMARQRLTRLKKASIKLGDDRVVRNYDKEFFQTTYIPKYKATNEELKRYQNQMLNNIANARKFLNLETSKVKTFRNWTTNYGKEIWEFDENGKKKRLISGKALNVNAQESKELWEDLALMKEINMSGFGSAGSSEQQEVIAYLNGKIKNQKQMSEVALDLYKRLPYTKREWKRQKRAKMEGYIANNVWKRTRSKD